MFRQKSTALLLIIVNVLIWGVFIYRLLFKEDLNSNPAVIAAQLNVVSKDKTQDTPYQLNLNYPDPFLKSETHEKYSIRKTHSQTNQNSHRSSKKEPAPIEVKNIPSLTYVGMVANNESGRTRGLVQVAGRTLLIGPNDTISGITFKFLSKDSLVAEWSKMRIVVKK